MKRPWIILGAGGHAAVVFELLKLTGEEVIGYVAPIPSEHYLFQELPYLGTDEKLLTSDMRDAFLANGIGSIANPTIRKVVYEAYCKKGYAFPPLIHPQAYVAPSAHVESGSVIMASACVQAQVRIAENVIVNTRAVVEHDCLLEAHVHISPGAVLCGGVLIQYAAHIGAAAVVREGITIGIEAIVGAGAVVITNVPDGVVFVGNPAKLLKKNGSSHGGIS